MSHAYNKHKKARRHSRPKHGHQLGKGQHRRRLSFGEKIRAAVGLTTGAAPITKTAVGE